MNSLSGVIDQFRISSSLLHCKFLLFACLLFCNFLRFIGTKLFWGENVDSNYCASRFCGISFIQKF